MSWFLLCLVEVVVVVAPMMTSVLCFLIRQSTCRYEFLLMQEWVVVQEERGTVVGQAFFGREMKKEPKLDDAS